jgi:tRNA U34 5-carboxymethylaminomethyl modifying GTPase MnmE/TrmE
VDGSQSLSIDDEALIDRARAAGKALVASNKSDLAVQAQVPGALPVSALTGAGIEELRRGIIEAIAPQGRLEQEGGFITSLRHEQLLNESG